MPLGEVVLLGAVRGIAEALPLSGAAHNAIARIWIEPGSGVALDGFLELGTLLGIAFAVRRKLTSAVGEGVRAIARPMLFRSSPGARDAASMVLAAVSTGVVRALVGAWAFGLEGAPLAIGTGLLITAAALVTAGLAPRGKLETPSFLGAIAIGAAVGFAVVPGVSGLAAALTVILWLGVRPARAIDLALFLALPGIAIACGGHLVTPRHNASAGVDPSLVAVGALVAFLCASIACSALRALFDRRRLAVLALWLTPLGLATIAYARALPDNFATTNTTVTRPV